MTTAPQRHSATDSGGTFPSRSAPRFRHLRRHSIAGKDITNTPNLSSSSEKSSCHSATLLIPINSTIYFAIYTSLTSHPTLNQNPRPSLPTISFLRRFFPTSKVTTAMSAAARIKAEGIIDENAVGNFPPLIFLLFSTLFPHPPSFTLSYPTSPFFTHLSEIPPAFPLSPTPPTPPFFFFFKIIPSPPKPLTHLPAVFSKSYCPYCTASKKLLSESGAKFYTIELDQVGSFSPFPLSFSPPLPNSFSHPFLPNFHMKPNQKPPIATISNPTKTTNS